MWQSFGVRDHDRGSRVVVISNHEYSEKFNAQIHRRSITQLVHDITQSKQPNYIKSNYCKPETLHWLTRTNKENNPVGLTISDCGTDI